MTNPSDVVDPDVLFLVEGKPVYRDDVLYHQDVYRTGGRVSAEFKPCGDTVTVRSDNGAVPSVKVKDLSWTIHQDTIDRMAFDKQIRANNLYGPFHRFDERDYKMWQLGRQFAASEVL